MCDSSPPTHRGNAGRQVTASERAIGLPYTLARTAPATQQDRGLNLFHLRFLFKQLVKAAVAAYTQDFLADRLLPDVQPVIVFLSGMASLRSR